MTRIAILPVPSSEGDISFHAIANGKHSEGGTAGEALDALTSQLSQEESTTLVIVQSLRPDRFFDAVQQKRLADLMASWRAARDRNESMSASEYAQLEALIDQELQGSAERSSELADETRK